MADEQISELAAKGLDGLGGAQVNVSHILDYVPQGMDDEDIPGLCAEHGIDVLITMNVKDFGAKKHYYRALMAHGVHVIVVRPGKLQPSAGQQVALVAQHFEFILKRLTAAEGPILIRARMSGAAERNLEQLLNEIYGLP